MGVLIEHLTFVDTGDSVVVTAGDSAVASTLS
jgi:hypothetical protein